MADYKSKLGDLATKLKTEKPKPAIQTVTPIKEPEGVKETQISLWLPAALHKKIKRLALEKDTSIKEITTAALEAYCRNIEI